MIENVSFVIWAALLNYAKIIDLWVETFDVQLMINIQLNFVQILYPIQILSSARKMNVLLPFIFFPNITSNSFSMNENQRVSNETPRNHLSGEGRPLCPNHVLT